MPPRFLLLPLAAAPLVCPALALAADGPTTVDLTPLLVQIASCLPDLTAWLLGLVVAWLGIDLRNRSHAQSLRSQAIDAVLQVADRGAGLAAAAIQRELLRGGPITLDVWHQAIAAGARFVTDQATESLARLGYGHTHAAQMVESRLPDVLSQIGVYGHTRAAQMVESRLPDVLSQIGVSLGTIRADGDA